MIIRLLLPRKLRETQSELYVIWENNICLHFPSRYLSIERSDVIIKLNCKTGNTIKIIDNCAENYENFL